MSEEILKALMQLFGIIAKQDEGVEANEIKFVHEFLAHQLNDEMVQEYMTQFKAIVEDVGTGSGKTRVIHSVKVLKACKLINKNLNQKQKVVVLVRVFELINSSKKFTELRLEIINTIADVFNISKEDFKKIEAFIKEEEKSKLDLPGICIIDDEVYHCENAKSIKSDALDGEIYILQIKSEDLYFIKYSGNQELYLNGLSINNRNVYLFASGSTIRLPKGKPIYYSDIASKFMEDTSLGKISFNVNHINFKFPNGELGLRDIAFSEEHGKLVGIMGASGAGKTTLLNVLTGIETPCDGAVLINGIDLHKERHKIEGVIGYIPQDDLLIEELTVFQNLYYNAKLCFRDKTEEELVELVSKTLRNLGLYERKDLKVGSPLNKLISGGQRKRLNIALELIREPSVLFVDEPTSGLSSRDSENVMDLLRELTLKGKLIFVVIHQPSSEIYKMFDKMIILDTGGYLIYYGNPVEAVMYFKRIDMQINSDSGECRACGNVNPELIFNIIDAKVVDEFGNYTDSRKVNPTGWEKHYRTNFTTELLDDIKDNPPRSLNIPKWLNQFKIYLVRDLLSKISNKQYIVLNLVEAPLLAFILSSIIRYIADPESSVYIFRENENIPPYLFMSIIVALFLGLTVSAEEIFRDRKILKREKFLNLSRSSYLVSKVVILAIISAIQALLFVIIGNSILSIRGMYFEYWYSLFSVFLFANMLGLNISATFNSAVTIYILIPLLMIPQMALGGAMFSFDKLNRSLGTVGKVPLIAEFMTSRWAYEGLMVLQYKKNNFEKYFFELDKKVSIADFKSVHYIPELQNRVKDAQDLLDDKSDSARNIVKNDLALVKNELQKEQKSIPKIRFRYMNKLVLGKFDNEVAEAAFEHLKLLDQYYSEMSQAAMTKIENAKILMEKKEPGIYNSTRKKYHNEKLTEIVKNIYEKNKIVDFKDQLIQQTDPIYLDPDDSHFFSFRSHFYAPNKHFMGKIFDTFWFNSFIIWLITILLYVSLYYDALKKGLNFMGKVKIFSKVQAKAALGVQHTFEGLKKILKRTKKKK